ncbi:hypothetical protein LTR05_005762 [Lithohypha guttulata]|uniref:Uncharacterized protein n=1 Tax=Lithohypha guttulata TaxID=1690604 RepID=A0AAN7Y680_9EURO|nr:hypothetical protein LTR05_005762 [Lithohypha guttulata]
MAPSSRITGSDSSSSVSGDESTTSGGRTRSSSYIFGQDVTDTYLAASTTSVPQGTAYNNNNNPAIAATSTYANPSPTSSDSNGGGGSTGTVLTPQQTQMVGGIVGGVAGIALVLIVLLYVLQWYRQRLKLQGRVPAQLNSGTDRDLGDAALVTMAAPMSQNSRTSLFPTIKKLRPVSGQTFFTDTTSMTGTDSEKGFQRVSGRKIPSVLATGGDQYGGSYGAFEKQFSPSPQAHSFGRSPFQRHHPHNDPNEISFYRDEDASYFSSPSRKSRSAPSSPLYPAVFTRDSIVPRRPSNPNTDRRDFAMEDFNRAFNRNMADLSKPDGFAISRNSPARTPLIQSPSTSTLRLPIQAPVTMDEDVPDLPLPSPGLIVGGSDMGGGGGMGLGLVHEVSRQRGLSRFDERGLGSPRFRD